MRHTVTKRPPWREVLEREGQLLLPAAHDALTAMLIERAGFPAYQIGGFALAGSMYGIPDIDLAHYQEQALEGLNIIAASSLPVLIDGDYGYGDVKNVVRTVQGYEHLGAAAIFIEDQQTPKKCGHMGNKKVIPVSEMEAKLRAAVGARQTPEFFIMARSDAIDSEQVEGAIERGKRYLQCGVDALYFEGPKTERELEKIAEAFHGVHLATSILEGGGKTPFLKPAPFKEMGYTMLLFPTTLLFQQVFALQEALDNLRHGRKMPAERAVNMEQFMEVVDLKFWQGIEKKYEGKTEE